MSEDDCGTTFALPVAEDLQVVPVTIDVTDDAMRRIAMSTLQPGRSTGTMRTSLGKRPFLSKMLDSPH